MEQTQRSHALQWQWIVGGILLTAGLLVLVMSIVDPELQRPGVSILMATVTLMFAGMLVGRISPGETVVEGGIVGAVIALVLFAYLTWVRSVAVPGIVWIAGPLYAATGTMIAAWVGEMLQGTVEDAHDDQPLDWPWVFVAVLCGFVLETYVLFLGEALLGLGAAQLLPIFFVSVFVTGWMVGFVSPGYTAIEPAIASTAMVILSAGLAALWLGEPLSTVSIIVGIVGGPVIGLAAGWLGEVSQSAPIGAAIRRAVRGA